MATENTSDLQTLQNDWEIEVNFRNEAISYKIRGNCSTCNKSKKRIKKKLHRSKFGPNELWDYRRIGTTEYLSADLAPSSSEMKDAHFQVMNQPSPYTGLDEDDSLEASLPFQLQKQVRLNRMQRNRRATLIDHFDFHFRIYQQNSQIHIHRISHDDFVSQVETATQTIQVQTQYEIDGSFLSHDDEVMLSVFNRPPQELTTQVPWHIDGTSNNSFALETVAQQSIEFEEMHQESLTSWAIKEGDTPKSICRRRPHNGNLREIPVSDYQSNVAYNNWEDSAGGEWNEKCVYCIEKVEGPLVIQEVCRHASCHDCFMSHLR